MSATLGRLVATVAPAAFLNRCSDERISQRPDYASNEYCDESRMKSREVSHPCDEGGASN